MDLRFQKRLLDLSFKMFVRGEGMAGQIPFSPQKTECFPVIFDCDPLDHIERATPESMGIPRSYIDEYLAALEADHDVNLHTIVILAGGKLIFAGAARPYSIYRPQLTYSMSKTVVGMAIGMLIAEGKLTLDDRAYTFFPSERLPAILGLRAKSITVGDLLTMRTGVTFSEGGAVTEEDWVRAFFESAVRFDPGKEFAYNSMNTYILSAIVSAVAGESINDYLTPRLWEPLGITSHFWECCPMGIPKGGWGLYLRPYDMAKLGQLMLGYGKYEGKQILSGSWAKAMMSPQASTPSEAGDYDYGYQMWVNRDGTSALFNGMFGQNVWLSRTSKIVVAMTSGNTEVFQNSSALRVTEKFFSDLPLATACRQSKAKLSATPIEETVFERRAWIRSSVRERERGLIARLFSARPEKTTARALAELTPLLGLYEFDRNNAGLLPLLIRLVQNNHTPGISSLELAREGRSMLVTLREGEARYAFTAGFGVHETSELDYNGERYLISAAAEFATNEDGERLLKLELAFPEIPSSRRVKLYFERERLRMKMIDLPGREIIPELLDSARVAMPKNAAIASLAKSTLNIEFIGYKITDAFERTLTAHKIRM